MPLLVMAGLVPAIHVSPPHPVHMDARIKSGHDERRAGMTAGGRLPARRVERERYPRPMKGILVAITVMNWTFASSGRRAM